MRSWRIRIRERVRVDALTFRGTGLLPTLLTPRFEVVVPRVWALSGGIPYNLSCICRRRLQLGLWGVGRWGRCWGGRFGSNKCGRVHLTFGRGWSN